MTHSDHIVPETIGAYWWRSNVSDAIPRDVVVDIVLSSENEKRVRYPGCQFWDTIEHATEIGRFLHKEPLTPPGE